MALCSVESKGPTDQAASRSEGICRRQQRSGREIIVQDYEERAWLPKLPTSLADELSHYSNPSQESPEIFEQGQNQSEHELIELKRFRHPANTRIAVPENSKSMVRPQASQFRAVSKIERSTTTGRVPFGEPRVRGKNRIGTSRNRVPR